MTNTEATRLAELAAKITLPLHIGGTSNPDSANPRQSLWGPRLKPEHQSGEWVAKELRPAYAAYLVAAANAIPELLRERERLLALVRAVPDDPKHSLYRTWFDARDQLLRELMNGDNTNSERT